MRDDEGMCDVTRSDSPENGEWFKSSFSVQGNCVMVRLGPEIGVRDSKDPSSQLNFTHPEWRAFIAGVRSGEFDLP